MEFEIPPSILQFGAIRLLASTSPSLDYLDIKREQSNQSDDFVKEYNLMMRPNSRRTFLKKYVPV